MARIVLLSGDLMFGSRMLAAMQTAGDSVVLHQAEPPARADVPGADALVVDLAAGGEGDALVAAMRAAGELDGVLTVAVYSHVDDAMRARAQAAGFDLILPRSRMAREGAALIADRLAASG